MGFTIYKDLISDDELLSQSFDRDRKEIDGIVYEVDCAMVTEGAVHVDTGANASAEEAEEALEDQEVKVNNVIHSFNLNATTYSKKDYLTHLKKYLKDVREKSKMSAEESKAFETGAQKYVKEKILPNFKDFEFYAGDKAMESGGDGMVVLLNYREDGTTPYVVYWKHGLRVESV